MATFDFAELRRFPDVEAENLFASDASDRLILDEAADAIADAPGSVVVIGDRYGALTLGAAALHGAFGIRTHQDPLTGEQALAHNAAAAGLGESYVSHGLDGALLAGARTVLLQLPKSLSELDEIAETIARHADPSVRVYAGGRVKHLTPAMNDVLGRHFDTVTATLARQKSRVLVASGPRSLSQPRSLSLSKRPASENDPSTGSETDPSTGSGNDPSYPHREFNTELGLWVCAHGGAFSGTRLDIGTRYLLTFLRDMKPDAVTAVDLGCGTGILASALAKSRPGLAVLATDHSAAAVASARATAEANGLPVTVTRDVGLATQPDDVADLIVLNPPFHAGSTVHAGVALKLFDEAARVLKPGGELWSVFNTHLRYRAALTRAVGPTRVVGQNPKFTVTVSTFEAPHPRPTDTVRSVNVDREEGEHD